MAADTGADAAAGRLPPTQEELRTSPRPFSPPPGGAPARPSASYSSEAEFFEPEEFRGMLYYDGLDHLGRTVVVLNVQARIGISLDRPMYYVSPCSDLSCGGAACTWFW